MLVVNEGVKGIFTWMVTIPLLYLYVHLLFVSEQSLIFMTVSFQWREIEYHQNMIKSPTLHKVTHPYGEARRRNHYALGLFF